MNTNLFSQVLPIAVASVTSNGVTYSYSETESAVALSMAYNESLQNDVSKILNIFFSGAEENKLLKQSNEVKFSLTKFNNSVKINLEKSAITLKEDSYNTIKNDIKSCLKSIIEL